jgi:NTE family protein
VTNGHRAGHRPAGKRIALVLQGGGALGAYQAGVYAALEQGNYVPDWVAGISIGSINAAIIAGNAPALRTARLREFWQLISSSSALWPDLPLPAWQEATRKAGALAALVFGQPGFFRPNALHPWISGRPATSFYDTSDLRATLERLVDFDRINAREMRFSAGAVNVRTGNFRYFDNHHDRIGPEHVMASGALPPGFPAVEIEGEMYWDGGLVSNTPLQYVLDSLPRRDTLAFEVDLFPARGPVPANLEAVEERRKDIVYSSRTRMGIDTFRIAHDMRRNIASLLDRLPPELRSGPDVEYLRKVGCATSMDVVNLVDRAQDGKDANKDFEFSRATMEARWRRGLCDGNAAVAAAPWLVPAPPEVAVRSFDIGYDDSTARAGHARAATR